MKIDTVYIDRMLNVILSPFKNLEFFENDIFKSSNNIEQCLEKLYPILNKEIGILNLDEIELSFRKFYCKPFENLKKTPEKNYLELLKLFSGSFLTHRDGEVTFKYWNSKNDIFEAFGGVEKVLIWNSLSRIIPTDIIGILFLKINGLNDLENLNNYYSIIKLEDKQLDSILKKGISETHLHASAATDFYNSWKNLMDLRDSKIASTTYSFDKVLGDCGDLRKFRLLGAIYRVLLALFLSELNEVSKENNFSEYLKENKSNLYSKVLFKELKSKTFEELTIDFSKLKDEILRKSNFQAEKLESLRNSDILRFIWINEDIEDIKTNEENIFLMKCLNYIDLSKNEDEDFLEYFFNYLKIKNTFFKIMVQGNKIKGLDNFVSYFGRSVNIGKDSDGFWWRNKLRGQFQDLNLKKVEFRISPKESLAHMKEELVGLLKSYKKVLEEDYRDKGIEFPEIGIIYHFLKKKDSSNVKKCWYKKCQDKLSHGSLSFNKNIIQYEKEKDNILELRKISSLSKYIVGIDGASIENNTEPWVFSSIYEKIRDSKNGYRSTNGKLMKSLGFSFHAGEDFRHIITGVRRIEECVKYFKYHSGDRIGHGIALGIDVGLWCEKHPIVLLPRIEHFENLIWMWGQSKEIVSGIDIGYLERKIFDVAKEIYGKIDGITIFNLWEMYCKKFEKFGVNEINLKKYSPCSLDVNLMEEERNERVLCSKINEGWTTENLLKAYHCEKYFLKMNEPIEVRIRKDEIFPFKKLQKIVLKKLAQDGIVIETNPTSNMAIGELKNIFEHYITNLNKLEYEKNDEDYNFLMASINSDDPSVFNSTLSNEFAYIYYSLINEGYPKELVLKWMDKIREYGVNSSFIGDKKFTLEETIFELDDIINKLNSY